MATTGTDSLHRQIRVLQLESRRQREGNGRDQAFQAEHPVAASAAEVCVIGIGICLGAKSPDPVPAGDFMGKSLFNKPIKNAIQGDSLDVATLFVDGLFDLIVAERTIGGHEYLQDRYACFSGPQSTRAKQGKYIR